MPPNNRWRVQGVDRKTRRLARQAAARTGITVGEWIDKAIITHGGLAPRGPTAPLIPAEFLRSARISQPAPDETTDPAAVDDDLNALPESDAVQEGGDNTAPESVPETPPAPEPLPQPEPATEAEAEAEPALAAEAEADSELTPEGSESEPEAVPLSVDPADRPPPPVPMDPAIAAAATSASRQMPPRIIGGVFVLLLLAGGYWFLADSPMAPTPSPAGSDDVTKNEAAALAVPAPAKKLSLANDLENTAPPLPQTPFERMNAAAGKGDPKAQHDLAIMYLRGNGVPVDHVQAASWLKKSAGSGIPKAQYNLGLLYEKGLGVTQNYTTAFSWYQRAAQQGHTRAQHNLGALFAVGKGTKQNYNEAARWFTRASKEGLAEAHYSLGLLHERGLGVKSDPRKAAAFYRSALAAGSAQAAEKLTRLEPALKELPLQSDNTLTASRTPVKTGPRGDVAKSRTLSPAGIINLQRLLAKLDLSPGPADGVLGRKTVEAIKLYQRFAGLPVDGKPTSDLLKDLRQVVGAMAPGGTN